MKIFRYVAASIVVTFSLLLSACDTNQALNKAFADRGLTRLALVRTDIQPGAIFVSSSKAAVFADNITDYIPSSTVETSLIDNSQVISGIIPTITQTKSIEPKVALDLLAAVMPIGGTGDFKFSSTVSVKQMTCKINRMKLASITSLLSTGGSLSNGLKPYFDDNDSVFVAVEVWRSSQIELDSESGTDITTSIKVGEVKPISKAEGSFALNRSTKEKLTVTGDQPYAFSVKLAKIERNPTSGNLTLKITNFHPPEILQGPDDQVTFASDSMQNFAPIRAPKSQRLAILKGQ
jgi:hypothetical protein